MPYKVWTTGHVVIPKSIRGAFGIRPGTEVEVFERGGEIIIRKACSNPGAVARRSGT
jgi:AbrB family looped-hinge helix DNA binding protein